MFEWFDQEVQWLETRTFSAQQIRSQDETPEIGSVVFYGSSSMRLWSTVTEDIGPLTGPPTRPIINLGFGGSTLGACVHYFDRLPGRVAREHGPLRSLVFYAGENDLGDGLSVEAVCDSFFWLHRMVESRLGKTPFAFISIKPSPERANILDRIQTVNCRIREKIKERPESMFIDVYSKMVDADGRPLRNLWSEDGIHLSRAGYDVWVETLTPYQDRLFR